MFPISALRTIHRNLSYRCLYDYFYKIYTILAMPAHNTLSFSVPYEAARSSEAELALEVLSPEDRVFGQAAYRTHVAEGSGVWNAEIVLREPMAVNELIWQCMRFTLRYKDQTTPDIEETRSLSEVLLRPVIHILAQRSYIAGAQAAMRVIVVRASREGEQSAVKQGWYGLSCSNPIVNPIVRPGCSLPGLLIGAVLLRRSSAFPQD
jgi:hypothetical protein